jgi:hypothetical protein
LYTQSSIVLVYKRMKQQGLTVRMYNYQEKKGRMNNENRSSLQPKGRSGQNHNRSKLGRGSGSAGTEGAAGRH